MCNFDNKCILDDALSLIDNSELVSKVAKLNKINRFFNKEINPEKIDDLTFFDSLWQAINKFQDIFKENPHLANLISLSLKEFLFVSNKLLFLIIKMIKNEYNDNMDKISSQNLNNVKTIEKKYQKEKIENLNLKNKIADLEQILSNNTNEMNKIKLLLQNNDKNHKEQIEQYKRDMEQKLVEEIKEAITKNNIETEKKLNEEKKINTELKNKMLELNESTNKRIFEAENNAKFLIFEVENAAEKKISEVEKEAKIKINDAEKRMDEKYNELAKNYNSLLKINLEIMNKEKEILKIFDNYNKIIKAKNEEKSYLEIQIDRYKNMLDKKDSELSSMKICLKNMKLELKKHNIQEFDDLPL